MKRRCVKLWLLFVVMFLFVFVPVSGEVEAAAIYDDFHSRLVDARKWQYLEKGTYVHNDKLMLEFRTSGVGYDFIDLQATNPDTIYGMRAKVQFMPESLNYLSNGDSFQVGFLGSFYTTDDGTYPGGTVIAAAYLEAINPSSAMAQVVYEVIIQYQGNWVTFVKGSLPIVPPLPLDSEATLTLEWEGDGPTFWVRLDTDNDGTPEQIEPFDGPSRSTTPLTGSEKAIELVVANGSSPPMGDKYGIATVDDVEIKDSVGAWSQHDQFTKTRIDAANWVQKQDPPRNFTRHGIENGQMFFTAQADGTATHARTRIDNRLPESEFTNYFKADITIDPSTSVTGVDSPTEDNEARVSLFAYVFNDTYATPTTDEGAVFPMVGIRELTGDVTQAFASVYRCADGHCATGADLFFDWFDCTVTPGTANTVSIEKIGSSFTFKCDGSVKTYTHSGNMYDHLYDFRRIRVGARASDAQQTDVKAYVDNVYTVKPSNLLLQIVPVIISSQQEK